MFVDTLRNFFWVYACISIRIMEISTKMGCHFGVVRNKLSRTLNSYKFFKKINVNGTIFFGMQIAKLNKCIVMHGSSNHFCLCFYQF